MSPHPTPQPGGPSRRRLLTGAAGLAAGLPLAQLLSGAATPASAATAYPHPGGMYTQKQLRYVSLHLKGAPYTEAYAQLATMADSWLGKTPEAPATLFIPGYYNDPATNYAAAKALWDDTQAALTCAACWALTGNATYAATAATVLTAWAKTNTTVSNQDSPLYMNYAGVAFVQAADLLTTYTGWSEADRSAFDGWVDNVFLAQAADKLKAVGNNAGDWGTYASIVGGHYRDDAARVQGEADRVRPRLVDKIEADGQMPGETVRGGNGLWYTYFALSPITATAQVMHNVLGDELFHEESEAGDKLRAALDYLLYYFQNPTKWPWATLSDDYQNPGDPQFYWPYDLFAGLANVYPDKPEYAAFAATAGKSPEFAFGHHHSWTMPTLMGFNDQAPS